MALWQYGTMAPWQYGNMLMCQYGNMAYLILVFRVFLGADVGVSSSPGLVLVDVRRQHVPPRVALRVSRPSMLVSLTPLLHSHDLLFGI